MALASPPNPSRAAAEPTAAPTTISAYRARFGRSRPVVAVIAENSGTELIDFVVPYSVLARSGVAEVLSVATRDGPVRMRPALRIAPQATTATFDARYPDGADYIIVPAVDRESRAGNPTLIAWLRAQADKGASLVSICDGALLVAEAGLFRDHLATGHWASYPTRLKRYPDTQWLTNTRYVADGQRISSAGVSAALPVALALVEAIAGHDEAATVAAEVGVSTWGPEHDSDQFRLRPATYALAIRNWLLRNQTVELPAEAGLDELQIAVMADAFSRTFRSKARLVGPVERAIHTRHGLTLLSERSTARRGAWRPQQSEFAAVTPAATLDWSLHQIQQRYGLATADFVALQLEYPR